MRRIAAVFDIFPRNWDVARTRVALVDALRGIAIVAMVVFHIGWDLAYFGFLSVDVTTDPGWVVFQKSIVTAFLLLVGLGLVLGHGDGIRWRGFWRRFALIAGAAVLTTAGTYAVFPAYFVYFGILHAIAAFSLMGLAFVRAPAWVAGAAGIVIVVLAFTVPPDAAMRARELSWIGFWPFPPETTDVVPVFPWLGVVLIGIAGTRALMASPAWAAIGGWRLDGAVGRALRWMGRWSLVIYLVHQPLLYGALSLVPPPAAIAAPDEIGFLRSCETTCQAGGGEVGFCARYCGCALEQVGAENLWDAVAAERRTAEEELAFGAVTRLCEAMAVDE